MSVVSVQNISKLYKLYMEPLDRLKEALHPTRRSYHKDFYALNNVNLDVSKGECVGIIGMNGSGKSTLLQIIAGVLQPTTGLVNVNGTISALLELGAGFNPEFTGVENVRFQCSIMGIPSSRVPDLLEKILSFADIGDFAYQPVKTYSSGMYVRLAFAVAINVDPDVLIVDEALAVGDAYFQAKCMKRIREFRDDGKTLLFVSHDPGAVKSLCDRAYLLHKGQVVDEGAPDQIFNFYNSLIAMKESGQEYSSSTKMFREAMVKRSGNQKIQITNVEMVNQAGHVVETFTSGENVTIRMLIHSNENISEPTIGILIRDRLGNDIFGINNHLMQVSAGTICQGYKYKVQYEMTLGLGPNIYSLTVAIHTDDTHIHESYDWINDALTFRVLPSPDLKFTGYCRLQPQFSVQRQSF